MSELVERLGLAEAIDASVGSIKRRDRGLGAGGLLVGMAAAQLAGQDFLVGLDRHRADPVAQELTPVPGLASTTAAGLARRIAPGLVREGARVPPPVPDERGLDETTLTEVPGWLHGAYPKLFEREHLRERLLFYDMQRELALYAHRPQPDTREAAQDRIARLLSGHNHLDGLIW